MDKIKTLVHEINNNNNILQRIDSIKNLNDKILKEQNKQKKYLDKLRSDDFKLNKKYKDFTLEDLKLEFDKNNNIQEKIKIYETIKTKINDIEINLFTNLSDEELDEE